MTHDIIGQQLDEALRLAFPDKGAREAQIEYAARKVFREFIDEYGSVIAPFKLSKILEDERKRVPHER